MLPGQICDQYVSCHALRSFEPRHDISNNVVCTTSTASDQPAHTGSLIRAFASVKLLTEQHLVFLSLKEATQARLSLRL